MVQGDPPGRRYPLDGEMTVLGRDAACDIVLADHQVSKRHARVVRKDGVY
jgi:pSer/pThr/pTyr-binding forkhead associated (FHA) protein